MTNYYKGRHAIVTGAAGFLGSHLVDALLENEAIVYGVDNLITGNAANIEHLKDNNKFIFYEIDANELPELYLPVEINIDMIFHFASPASPKKYQAHPRETYLVNTQATDNLLSYLRTNNSNARFLFAGTSEIYGDPKIHPQPETYWGNVNPNGVRSCYDEAKRMGETICGVYYRDFNIDTRIVRIFNTYGPRLDPEDGRVISNFVNQILNNEKITIYGDGSQTRSYCFVSDLIEGILRLGGKPGLAGTTVNIGNPDEKTVLETAETIQQVIKKEIDKSQYIFMDLPKDDPTKRCPDITKAKQFLEWEPRVTFKDGIKKTVKYYLDNKES